MKRILVFIFTIGIILNSYSQGFISYKLKNGLTVYLWEDHRQTNVFGSIVVRAGSIDEPLKYTGLAHYLEHVMFKGTEKIGSFNWEKEQPHYENIIKLYDEHAATTEPLQRAELEKKINEESLEAAKYCSTTEFSNLVQSIGGEGLNAGTSYDNTVYYNSFPSFQLEKWLDLYSERFIHPVFRSFQAELENVFEEYNMYEDNNMTHIRKFLFSNLYAGSPYDHDIVGFPEHLKNPQLSKLIEFYNTWYVPNNMALILIGNFDSKKIVSLIDAKFSRLQAKPLPERTTYPETDFSKKLKLSAKIGYSPMVMFGYKTVPIKQEDEYLLDFCANLLTNSMQTGLLDKLTNDGDVQYASASLDSRRDQGRFIIQAVPYYDVSQRIYESDRATEKKVMQQVDKLKTGNIDEWLIESVKKSLLRQMDLSLESLSGKNNMLQTIFSYQLPPNYFVSLADKINAVTKEDIQRVAQKYLIGDHMTFSIEPGTPKKNKLKKPEIKPIEPAIGQKSAYSVYFKSIPVTEVEVPFNSFSEVKNIDLYNDIHLHYTENPLNDYFSLVLKYGIGTTKMPKLEYAVQLMNSAGIMPSSDAQDVRRQFSELDATCTFSVTNDYLYINLVGSEDKLEEICKLMTRLTLLPKLDDKQLNRIIGREFSSRLLSEKNNADVLGNALLDYALYKDKSDYVDRLKLTDLNSLKISDFTGEIIHATDYELDIHYVGRRPFPDVTKLLQANLPMKEGVIKSESPVVKARVNSDKPVIYFLPNSDVQQAQIYFYFDGVPFKLNESVYYDAFVEYFSGSFNGLVMQEIREKNSMAYTAAGRFLIPPVQDKNSYFLGYIGTQSDKAANAIDVFMNLLKDMPFYPERINDIKTYLKQSYLAAKPSFRNKSQIFENWKKLGYTDDPAKINLGKIEALQFTDIVNFYEKYVKGKPVSIVIMGDGKLINLKQIETNQGKITKVNASRLFSNE
jgi:predicted Zn-dependent peptidase